jgi:D-inositol-3-phosphate glycosyltransferase
MSAAVRFAGEYRVVMVDPACYTPSYTVPLCHALLAGGVDVRLCTSRFHYDRTRRDESRAFIELAFGRASSRLGLHGTPRRMMSGIEYPLGWFRVLARLRRTPRPVIVHSQWLPVPPVDVRFLAAARRQGAIWVHTVHNLEPRHVARGSTAAFQRAYVSADRLLVHCRATAEGLTARFGVAADTVSLVPMGPALEGSGAPDRASARRRLGLPSTGALLLFFGIVREDKGIEPLIEAVSRIAPRHPDLRLVIAGRPQGLRATRIRDRVRASGLDEERAILRLAYVPTGEVPLYFAAASLVAYPYLKADQSAALTLALVHGRAAVVSDLGGLAELVDDTVSGRVVAAGDVDGLAAALDDLLSDEQRLDSMGRAARDIAGRQLSWSAAAERTAVAYEAAVQRRVEGGA